MSSVHTVHTMAMVTNAHSFGEQVDHVTELRKQSMKNDAMIRYANEAANLAVANQTELEGQRKMMQDQLEAVKRLLVEKQQHTSQLREDIDIGQQYARSFKLRSDVDAHEDDPPLDEDAQRRKSLADQVVARARHTQIPHRSHHTPRARSGDRARGGRAAPARRHRRRHRHRRARQGERLAATRPHQPSP